MSSRPLLFLAAALSLAALPAQAHQVGTPPGYTRMVYDCSHDWGWESGFPQDKGHELNSVDVIEKRIAGEFLFVVEPLLVKAESGSQLGTSYGMRETIRFETPRGSIETVLDSTAESALTFVSGTQPHYLGPRNHGPYSPSDGSIYDLQLGYEVGYRYSTLQLQRGDVVRAFTMQAEHQDGAAWRSGDAMPADNGNALDGSRHNTPGMCHDGTGQPSVKPYVADGYTIQRSNWFPNGAAAGDAPLVDFATDPPNPAPNQAITFQDASLSPTGRAMTAWKWDFGDGTLSTQQEPRHAYQAAGTYTVTLTATDDAGKAGSVERDVHVAQPAPPGSQPANQPAQVNFRLATQRPLAGQEVAFEDRSHDPDGAVSAWSWDFGDQSPASTQKNPTHTYAEAGIYRVVLTVTDTGGLQSRVVKEVQISATEGGSLHAIADFARTPAAPTVKDAIRFVDSSQEGDAPLAAWEWDFGDEATASGREATHQYAKPGRYQVLLQVTDAAGHAATVRKDVVVQNLAPVAAFRVEPASPIVGEAVRLVDASMDEDGRIVAWEWYLGARLPVFGKQQETRFAAAGTYTLTLTVTDELGVTHTLQQDIRVTAAASPQEAGKQSPAPGPLVLVGLLALALLRRNG